MKQNQWCSLNQTWVSLQQDVDKNTLMLRCNKEDEEKKKKKKGKTNEQENDTGDKDEPQNGACAVSGNHCMLNLTKFTAVHFKCSRMVSLVTAPGQKPPQA